MDMHSVYHHNEHHQFNPSLPPLPGLISLESCRENIHHQPNISKRRFDHFDRAAAPSPPLEAEREADLESFRQNWLAEIDHKHARAKDVREPGTNHGTDHDSIPRHLRTRAKSVPDLDDDNSSIGELERSLSHPSLYSQRNDSGFALVDSVLAGSQSSPARSEITSDEEMEDENKEQAELNDHGGSRYLDNYTYLPATNELLEFLEMESTPRNGLALEKLSRTSRVLGKRGRSGEGENADENEQRLKKLFAPLYDWHSEAGDSPAKRVKTSYM